VVPILRAGLVPLEQIATVLPAYETYHVGLVRDEQTLQVVLVCRFAVCPARASWQRRCKCVLACTVHLDAYLTSVCAFVDTWPMVPKPLSVQRDLDTFQASWYLNKLPESFAPDDRVLISDPMMATGGTMVKASAPCLVT